MTRESWIATFARVFCGVVFLVHGTPKILNLAGTSTFFSENFGIPGWIAIPVAILEFFGGILLITGFLTRVFASLFVLEKQDDGGWLILVHESHSEGIPPTKATNPMPDLRAQYYANCPTCDPEADARKAEEW